MELRGGWGKPMPNYDPAPIWLVVKVERGVPVQVEAFAQREVAVACEGAWRAHTAPEERVGMFKVRVSSFV